MHIEKQQLMLDKNKEIDPYSFPEDGENVFEQDQSFPEDGFSDEFPET